MKPLTPITVDQIRAALDPDDFAWHEVTASDAALMGLNDAAEARLFAWLRERGWSMIGEAAGNYHFSRDGEHIWLEEHVDVAAATIVNALRGEGELLPQHGIVTERDERPGYEILAEIVSTEPTSDDVALSNETTGGGLMVISEGRVISTDSWG